jgi:hypothetical protein
MSTLHRTKIKIIREVRAWKRIPIGCLMTIMILERKPVGRDPIRRRRTQQDPAH